MNIRYLLPLLLVASACSSDSDGTNNVTSNNATNNAASNNATNNATSNNSTNGSTNNVVADMGSDAQVVADSGDDMGLVDLGSDATVDAGNDVGDPYASRPVGQCAVSADCPTNPNGKDCNRLLPGGSCGACDAFNDLYCDDTCFSGTCVTTCATTDECPPGLRCTGSGRCAAQPCLDDVCPVPMFGCSASGLCQRIDCSADSSVCPVNTTCSSGLCIEDRQL